MRSSETGRIARSVGEGDEGGLDGQSTAAITLGILAWVSFLLAWFMLAEAWLFLVLAVGFGAAALVLGLRAKRDEEAAVAAGATAAGAAMVYGMTLTAVLAALVYAAGVLLVLAILFFFWWMSFWGAERGGQGCTCGGRRDDGGDPGCCCCPVDGGGSSGGCCGGCGCGGGSGGCGCSGPDCGGSAGGGGGCGCVALALPALPGKAAALARSKPLRERLRAALRQGAPHHPDLPEYEADVYRVGGAPWCVGCFTTYPTFLGASAALLLAPLAAAPALVAGGALALLQGVSSAGLARRRTVKILVKLALGIGLALVLHGVRQAPWAPGWKLAALAATLALALLSALPRARRMRRARAARARQHEACACGVSSPATR